MRVNLAAIAVLSVLCLQAPAWADDDLQIIQEMARQAGIALPQADLSRELCRAVKPKKFRLDEYGR